MSPKYPAQVPHCENTPRNCQFFFVFKLVGIEENCFEAPSLQRDEVVPPLLAAKKINTLKRIPYSTQLLYSQLPLAFYAISLISKGWNIHISTNAVQIGEQSVKNSKNSRLKVKRNLWNVITIGLTDGSKGPGKKDPR